MLERNGTGTSSSRHHFNSHVGIGSSSHDLFEELFIIFLIYSFDAFSKRVRHWSTSPGFITNFDFISSLKVSIFSTKKSLNFCGN